jgi:hypothetical protein
MKQFTFQHNQLTIKVKKAPLFVRLVLFPIAILFFLIPTFAIILTLAKENGISFYSLIFVAIFFAMGFYLLRITLCNTFGQEIFKISTNKITYTLNFGWFKYTKKEIALDSLHYTIKTNEDENKGVLVFGQNEMKIESAVQISIIELEENLIKLSRINT